VGAEGTQPAEHAKAERDGQNRYRGLYYLTRTVRQAACERYKDDRQYRQRDDAKSDELRRHNRCSDREGRYRDWTENWGTGQAKQLPGADENPDGRENEERPGDRLADPAHTVPCLRSF
jgi:hypothetical protein